MAQVLRRQATTVIAPKLIFKEQQLYLSTDLFLHHFGVTGLFATLGWDLATGGPTPETLKEMEIDHLMT